MMPFPNSVTDVLRLEDMGHGRCPYKVVGLFLGCDVFIFIIS